MRITEDLGELIRELREARGITRRELAEQADVSISHLEKIESGQRNPGMGAFIRIMMKLDVNISLYCNGDTVHEKCSVAIKEVVLGCSEGEASFLAQTVKDIAENFRLMA